MRDIYEEPCNIQPRLACEDDTRADIRRPCQDIEHAIDFTSITFSTRQVFNFKPQFRISSTSAKSPKTRPLSCHGSLPS
ncbi:hypothetical protein TNCV_2111411 [Trichonephila clavipes]|nr:hypothetical protein TNCV_2111411 [Trichonephila clavipes]